MARFVGVSLAIVLGFAPLAAAAPSHAPAAPSSPAQDIDRLYQRLARTPYSDEAAGIIAEIDHLRQQSGSDAADLLFGRALKARASANVPLALKLLDAVVYLYPDWPQAWKERATTRFQSGDSAGAMTDLAQTLKRDPRDVDALTGLAAMMLDSGNPEAALKVYDSALTLAPAYEPLKEARVRAQTEVWSRSP